MSMHQINDIPSRISDLYKSSRQIGLIPVITTQGIAIGSSLIKLSEGSFVIYKNRREYYRTHSKNAAMIIAGLMNKDIKVTDIAEILYADQQAFSARNDLEIYKHHYDLAVKRKDYMKKALMEARFDVTDGKYRLAKKIIKDSYSKLF